ncbi:hypothetical protein BYT27DRAFT_6904628 [Phlegmacium glaucopus]|nr:hypothetical protein BYT27DRAFT_6904628 [Phlegmacium glaucopus]
MLKAMAHSNLKASVSYLFTLTCRKPTAKIPEFCCYLSGSIFNETPWNRIPSEMLSLIRGMLTVNPIGTF